VFNEFGRAEMSILYRALLDSILANRGNGFRSGNQGHPAYVAGCKGEIIQGAEGDSPNINKLYQMMRDLSDHLVDSQDFRRSELVHSWTEFCQMAVNGYNASKGRDINN
jgi:hypothetical protein